MFVVILDTHVDPLTSAINCRHNNADGPVNEILKYQSFSYYLIFRHRILPFINKNVKMIQCQSISMRSPDKMTMCIAYCLMHRSVTFDFEFAFGMKPSDITFCLCLTAHASTWLISYHISPWQTMPKWDLIELFILNKVQRQ